MVRSCTSIFDELATLVQAQGCACDRPLSISSGTRTSPSRAGRLVCYISSPWPTPNRFFPLDLFPVFLAALPRLCSVGAQARRVLWLVAIALAVPSALATAKLYLNLRSDLEELLPGARQCPGGRRVALAHAWLLYLGVLVDVGAADNLPQASVYLTTWRPRARLSPDMVRAVRWGRPASGASLSSTSLVHGSGGSRNPTPAHRRPHPLRVDEGSGHAPRRE